MPFELRIYRANPGKMPALLKRFREHTIELFTVHGMESIGYWISETNPEELIYVLKHSGNPEENWKAFLSDPRWIEVQSNSEVDGALIESISSYYMSPTDFSRIN